jgi:hypothetical protein
MSAIRKTTLAKALAAWGGLAPDWLAALAAACDATSGRAVAARLDVSPAAVCRVLGGTYGNTAAIERRVRTVLMTTRVICPVCGEIEVAACRTNQARPFTAVNPLFVRLYQACPACPHREADHEPHARTGSGHPATDRAGPAQTGRTAAAGSAQNPGAAARTSGG